MMYMIVVEDDMGMFASEPEFFDNQADAVSYGMGPINEPPEQMALFNLGDRPLTLRPGQAVMLYEVREKAVLQEVTID
jgi:hypothetical protein